MLTLLLGFACSNNTTNLVSSDPVEQACLDKHCKNLKDPEVCRKEKCSFTPQSWTLTAERIGYRDETLFVEAAVKHNPGTWGEFPSPRTAPVYVGVTAVTKNAQEIDLAVQTRFEDDLEAPFFLTAEVGPDVEYVIMGLWDHKIEPCDSDRMGCKEFGFLLDGSLATWPPKVYVDGRKQRIPTESFIFRVNASESDFAKVEAAIKESMKHFDLIPNLEKTAEIDTIGVFYRSEGDAITAESIAEKLNLNAIKQDLPDDSILISLGSK